MKTNLSKESKEETTIGKEVSNDKIHCGQILLRYSKLEDISENDKSDHELQFKVTPRIKNNNLFLELHIRIENVINSGPIYAQSLTFGLIGHFIADEDVPMDIREEFAQNFTLGLLWPYAREYANDVFRRAGRNNVILPVINAQGTTQEMVEQGKIKVTIDDDIKKE
jgi:preprotein translocase subunit SecB